MPAGDCTAAEFAEGSKYADEQARATMDHAQFQDWWKKLVSALRAPLTLPVYNMADLTGGNLKQNDVGKQLPEVLGVRFDKASKDSWFFQHEVVF